MSPEPTYVQLAGFTVCSVVCLLGGKVLLKRSEVHLIVRRLAAVAAVTILLGMLIAPSHATTVTEYVIPGTPGPWDICVDKHPNGTFYVWFTDTTGNSIGRLTPGTSELRQIYVPSPNSQPWGITRVPSAGSFAGKAIVFTEVYGNNIGMVERDSFRVVEYGIPTAGSSPRKIVYDDVDDCVWFTEYIGKIGRFKLVPGGPQFAEYSLPSGATPVGLAIGQAADRYIWYADPGRRVIGRLNRWNAVVKEFSVYPFNPWDVAVDTGGKVWFTATQGGTSLLGMLNPLVYDASFSPPRHPLTLFSIPTPNADVHDLKISNVTGDIWFAEFSDFANKIGKFSPLSNTFSEYPIITPTAKTQGLALYHDSDGAINVWFAEYGGRRIGRLRQPEGPTVMTTVYSTSSAVTTSTTALITTTWSTPSSTAAPTTTVSTFKTVSNITVLTSSSTMADTSSIVRTSPTYWTTTYTYTTSTSFTTTTTTVKATIFSGETTTTTTTTTSTSTSTSWEGFTTLTTLTVTSVSVFTTTTTTTTTDTLVSTTYSPTVTVPTTAATGALTTIYSPTITLTSTTFTETTTTTTSSTSTTTTLHSPTLVLTLTTTTTATALPLGALRPCIIASAAYGSELAPQVQLLRDFREQEVLSTFAGSNFMKVFNEFYYSFSPTVASVVSSSQVIAAPTRVMLYPLIGTLQVSSTVFHGLGFAPEIGMILAGVFSSALLGIVYALPPVLGVRFLLRNKTKLKMLVTNCSRDERNKNSSD